MGYELPSTAWSQILAAGDGAAQAMEDLATRYLSTIYAYVRSRGYQRERAEDLTHDFFVFLLQSRALAKADPNRGRFRAFLFTCLRNFLSNEAERQRALKRGGGRAKLSLDVEGAERTLGLYGGEDPRALFDRQWALDTIARAMERLQQELTPSAAEAFSLAQEPHELPYKEIATKLGMTEQAVAASVYRSRKKLRRILLEEVAATVEDEGEAPGELDALFQALAGGSRAR